MVSTESVPDRPDRSDHKERVQAQFGPMAAAYAASSSHGAGPDLAELVKWGRVHADSLVLDAATGSGHTALAFAPHVRAVVAADITLPMLQAAHALALARGITNMICVQADAEALPFLDDSFDVVTSRIAPHHFGNLAQAVREFARVLRPRGRLLIVDNAAPDDPALDEFINGVERLRDPTHVRSYTAAEWQALAVQAGLTVTHHELFRRPLEFAPWAARARMPEKGLQQLVGILRAAPAAVREQFDIVLAGETVKSLSLYDILLVADKPAA